MTTVYLIRHAEAEGNLYRRAQGHEDSVITDRGYRQIAALSRRFDGVRIDAVYASDLFRTQATAQAIAMPRALPVHTTPLLREVRLGVWEGRTWAYLAHAEGEQLSNFNGDCARWHIEGGEPIEALRERMLGALRAIIAENPDRTVAVFSHGMALRMLIGTLQGLPLSGIDKTSHAENTAVTRLEAEGDAIRVVYRDDASHLPDELATVRAQTWWRRQDGYEPSGVYYEAEPDAPGAFRVMCGGKAIGALRVHTEGGVCVIDRYELVPELRGRGCGVQPVGQALHYGRGFGCDRVRITIPRENALGQKRFLSYGFAPVGEDAASVTYEKYFGRDLAERDRRIRKAMEEDRQ